MIRLMDNRTYGGSKKVYVDESTLLWIRTITNLGRVKLPDNRGIRYDSSQR